MAFKREVNEAHKGDKRYIRRDTKGRIKESDDMGRSRAADSPGTRQDGFEAWSGLNLSSVCAGVCAGHRPTRPEHGCRFSLLSSIREGTRRAGIPWQYWVGAYSHRDRAVDS